MAERLENLILNRVPALACLIQGQNHIETVYLVVFVASQAKVIARLLHVKAKFTILAQVKKLVGSLLIQ